MKTNPATPTRTKHTNILLRNAAEPFPIPLSNYALPLQTFLGITGKTKHSKIWYHHTIRFMSFIGQVLTLTITHEKETYTLNLLIQAQQLTISCSCKSSVATLCIHAYEYLINVARIGGEYAFTDFAPGGIIETALAHKPYFAIQYTGKHGIRAQLKNGAGRIYHLENNWVTPAHLQAYYQLPGAEESFVIQPQSNEALCYLLMSSPRN